jgi:hypothetical protein
MLYASVFELKQTNMHKLKIIVKVSFVRSKACQLAFEELKKCLMLIPILVRLDSTKMFILDVDWSTKGVEAILCQQGGRKEVVVAYASKDLFESQKSYHPMEGECYTFCNKLIWGKSSDFVKKKRLNYSTKACWYPSLKRKSYW